MQPFDSGGGQGWKILSGQIIYFHHELDQKIYFQVYQGQTIYFYPQQKFEKEKKNQTQKNPRERGGGGFRMLVRKGARSWTGFSMGFSFYFCTLPGSVCACIL